MILETTYGSREVTQEINKTVGLPYSLLERIRMKGIGSKRMKIKDVNAEYAHYFDLKSRSSFANIELRPKGIIIHFRQKLESFVWLMPFDSLEIESSSSLVLRSGQAFICFDSSWKNNEMFIGQIRFYMS